MNDDLRDVVRQWLTKAQGDWTSVEILAAHERCPREAVCYHCQQYAEKLLKALLTLHGQEAPRPHDLRRLVQLAAGFAPGLQGHADRLDALSWFGVHVRYPDGGREVTEAEMREAIEVAEGLAAAILPRFADIA